MFFYVILCSWIYIFRTFTLGSKSYCRSVYSAGYLFTSMHVSCFWSDDRVCNFTAPETQQGEELVTSNRVFRKESNLQIPYKRIFECEGWKQHLRKPFESRQILHISYNIHIQQTFWWNNQKRKENISAQFTYNWLYHVIPV